MSNVDRILLNEVCLSGRCVGMRDQDLRELRRFGYVRKKDGHRVLSEAGERRREELRELERQQDRARLRKANRHVKTVPQNHSRQAGMRGSTIET